MFFVNLIVGMVEASIGVALAIAALICLGVSALILYDYLLSNRNAARVRARVVAVRMLDRREKKDAEAGGAAKASRMTFNDQAFAEQTTAAPFTALIIAVPLLFFAIGGLYAWPYLDLSVNGVPAEANLLSYDTKTDGDDQTFHAMITFTDDQGRFQRATDRIETDQPILRPGARLLIAYDREHPDRFIIRNFWHNMTLPISLMAVSFSLLLLLASMGRRVHMIRRSESGKLTWKASTQYYPIVQFQDAQGEKRKAQVAWGASALGSMLPGDDVWVQFRSDRPRQVSPSSAALLWLIPAGILCLPGLLLLSAALASLSPDLATVLVVGSVGGWVWLKLKSLETPPQEIWNRFWTYREQKLAEKQAQEISGGTLLDRAQCLNRLRVQDRAALFWVPALFIIGLMMVVMGAQLGRHKLTLTMEGARAEGQVTDVRRLSTDMGIFYHPYIQFADGSKVVHGFVAQEGGEMPTRRIGQIVRVAYSAEHPQQAAIDAGIGLFDTPGLWMIGGSALILLAGRSYAIIRRRRAL